MYVQFFEINTHDTKNVDKPPKELGFLTAVVRRHTIDFYLQEGLAQKRGYFRTAR